jgi:DNA repair protein SbcC/Rad50
MTAQVFLKQLHVSGFRGIRRELALDFGRRLTIVAGGNASGKSSIVQAIQYALTGEVSDQHNKAIKSDYLRHLDGASAGQVRLNLATPAFVDDGSLSASTAETRVQIRNRAAARLVRDWTGAGEPPFTITHLTSQELLSELLSPDTRLSRNNVASLFSDSHLRQMTRRAEVLTEYCRRLAHGDNSRTALLKLTDRLESAKAFRDGLAVTLALPSQERRDIDNQIRDLAKAVGVSASGRDALPSLRDAIKRAEELGQKRVSDVRFVAALAAGLAESEQELAVAQQALASMRTDLQLLQQRASELATTIQDLQRRADALRPAVQRARNVVESGSAYELWNTRLRSLTESLADARRAAEELQARMLAVQADQKQSQELLASRNEALIRLDERRRDAQRRLAAISMCVQLPISRFAEEVNGLDQRLEIAQHVEAAMAAAIASVEEEARVASDSRDRARLVLNERSAALLRVAAAVEALAEVGADAACPLCGHDHGSLERLASSIAGMRKRRLEALDASQRAADDATKVYEVAESKLTAMRLESTTQRRATQAIAEALARAKGELASFEARRAQTLTSAGLPGDLSDAVLEDRSRELQLTLDGILAESSEVAGLRDQTQSIDLEHSSRATSLKAQYDQAIRTRDQIDQALREQQALAPQAVGADAVAEAQRQTRELSGETQEIQTSLAVALSQQSEVEQKTQANTTRIVGLAETVRQLEERIAQVRSAAKEHGISQLTATALAVDESNAVAAFARAAQRRDELRSLEDYFVAMDAAERLRSADADVVSATEELRNHQLGLTRLEAYRVSFQNLYNELLQRQTSLAESMLEATAEPCAQLFHAMTAGCPWPLSFKIEDDRIVALLGAGQGTAHAASILNAAYFNVAAVALRLALAAHQTWSQLRAVVFDDPILEMDNLTQAALIDGLESVLTSVEEPWSSLQLVITTWSDEFALMAAHKLAHLNEQSPDNFVVYQLESDPSGSPTASRFTPYWEKRSSAA